MFTDLFDLLNLPAVLTECDDSVFLLSNSETSRQYPNISSQTSDIPINSVTIPGTVRESCTLSSQTHLVSTSTSTLTISSYSYGSTYNHSIPTAASNYGCCYGDQNTFSTTFIDQELPTHSCLPHISMPVPRYMAQFNTPYTTPSFPNQNLFPRSMAYLEDCPTNPTVIQQIQPYPFTADYNHINSLPHLPNTEMIAQACPITSSATIPIELKTEDTSNTDQVMSINCM